jgi:multiple sugar transport system substrate-binding protein
MAMANRAWTVVLAAGLVCMMILAGCGNGGTTVQGGGAAQATATGDKTAVQGKGAEVKPAEPVELTFLGSTVKSRFDEIYGNFIYKKLPNYKLNYYLIGAKDDEQNGTISVTGALAKGMDIDIMHVGLGNVQSYLIDTKLGYDINELVKKYNYDLKILYPQAVNAAKSAGKGALYGLPVNTSVSKIYYNKDLFDKFGVSYPKDGLTWDETYDLTKRMTRTVDGKTYQGGVLVYSQLVGLDQLPGMNFIDPKTNTATFNGNPNWKKIVDNMVRFQQIPGNEKNATVPFTNDGTVAMMIAKTDLNSTWKVNWDIARAPVFADNPTRGESITGSIFTVVSSSKHKDEAFQVVAAIASKEHMLEMAQIGNLSVLNDPQVKQVFGQNIPWLKDRKINLAAMFPVSYTEAHEFTPYDGIAQNNLVAEMNKVITGKTPDVNSALRQANDKTNSDIAALLTK